MCRAYALHISFSEGAGEFPARNSLVLPDAGVFPARLKVERSEDVEDGERWSRQGEVSRYAFFYCYSIKELNGNNDPYPPGA